MSDVCYVLTHGVDDYCETLGVFDSPEKALEYSGFPSELELNKLNYYIYTKPLNPRSSDIIPIWTVCLSRAGTEISSHFELRPRDWVLEDFWIEGAYDPMEVEWYFKIQTRNKDEALKIANERRISLINSGKWDNREL